MRELLEHAPEAQRVVAATRPSDKQLDKEFFEVTEGEALESGLLRSTTPAELGKRYGPRWVPARRFGIRQGKKLCPIDDFSAQGHNATVETSFKVDLGGVDEVIAVARAMGAALAAGPIA